MPVTAGRVLTALKDCHDPEIPVNIVDLGWSTGCFGALSHRRCGAGCDDDLTLTSPGCPSHVQIMLTCPSGC